MMHVFNAAFGPGSYYKVELHRHGRSVLPKVTKESFQVMGDVLGNIVLHYTL